MKKFLMVLGCCGFVVSPASAGKWSAETCKHLQEMKADIKAMGVSRYEKALMLLPVMSHQTDYCGPIPDAEYGAIEADLNAGGPRKGTSQRQPMHCLTVPMTGGDSATSCN